MFTGIITGVGRIAAVHDLGSSLQHGKRLTLEAPAGYLDDVGPGDSIALNGACMTVTTLDTARRYCDRVIGMRDGRIVFDGTPDQLSTGVARDIYGADASFNESATSTTIPTDTSADVAYAQEMLA